MGKEKNMGTHNKAGFPVGSDGKESAYNAGPSALPVCLMASFIITSLQGAWGSTDSPLYLFSIFVTICTFLSSPSLGDQSK